MAHNRTRDFVIEKNCSDSAQGCQSLLAANGLRPDEMGVGRPGYETVFLDGFPLGFFTIRREHGLPYVVHLAGGAGTAWALARKLKETLRKAGETRAILNIPVAKPKLLSAARRVLRAKPYAESEGHIFLMMEVDHGKH